MLFRIKVVKCLDIVVEGNDLGSIVREYRELIGMCNESSQIYVHVLERKDNELVDKGLMYRGNVREALRGSI
ncbi:MAG: hypothetical protein ABWW65_07715 [Thermoprotei archaeon]